MSHELWPWNCEIPKESIQRCPKTPPKSCSVIHGPSSVVWSHIWLGPQPNAIWMNCYSCGSSHVMKDNKSTIVSVRSAMVLWLCVRPTSKTWFWKISPSDHETWPTWCHVGIHVDFSSLFHSHTPLVPQAWCEANLDRLHLLHQWECLKCDGHGLWGPLHTWAKSRDHEILRAQMKVRPKFKGRPNTSPKST